MRVKALIVLIALISSIMTPVSFNVYSSKNKTTIIVTLDVCNAAGHSVSVNSESAIVYELPCRFVQLMFNGFYEIIEPAFFQFILAFLSDHPPKV